MARSTGVAPERFESGALGRTVGAFNVITTPHHHHHTTTTMPRELHQTPALPTAFKKRRCSRGRSNLSMPRTRWSTPRVRVPAWCKLTADIIRAGPESLLYQHALDRYCIEECEFNQ